MMKVMQNQNIHVHVILSDSNEIDTCLKPELKHSGTRRPLFKGVLLWNSLPHALREMQSVLKFNVLRKLERTSYFHFYCLKLCSYCTSKSSYFLLLHCQKFIFFVSLFLNQSLFLLWTFPSYHVHVHKYFFSLYKFSSPT